MNPRLFAALEKLTEMGRADQARALANTCCDFHGDPTAVQAHRAQWATEYGLTRRMRPIESPPSGWALVPFGEQIPPEHREYIEGAGWAWPRRGHSTVTPLFARPAGPVRAYAAPESYSHHGNESIPTTTSLPGVAP